MQYWADFVRYRDTKVEIYLPMTQTLPHEQFLQPSPAVLQFLRNFARTYKPLRPSC